jgi:hypothetical protein
MNAAKQCIRILSFRKAVHPRNSVSVYATVASRSRGTRLNHSVAKHGRVWRWSCEANTLGGHKCAHIRRVLARAQR